MIPSGLLPIVNHLWQSTLFAAVAGLLTLALRKNWAQTRYRLWLAASIKFLIPFSLLVDIGSHWGRHAAPAITPPVLSYVIEQVSQPFSFPTPLAATTAAPASWVLNWVPAVLSTVWAIGFATLICSWCRRWRGLRVALRTASPLDLQIGMEAVISPAFAEPGVFGVCQPVLLLPAGITDRLTPPQLKAVVVHELCHIRRRDNLTTALHMAVEALFWFHPLVWWLGARLMAERERACDEEVLLTGSEPEAYAEGILKICELYLESPLPCVSGVTGADLKQRIERIMTQPMVWNLSFRKKLMLSAAGVFAMVLPVGAGLLRAQTDVPLAFEVASVKASAPNQRGYSIVPQPGGGLLVRNAPLITIIGEAYSLQRFQISGAPGWANMARFDIDAKAGDANATRAQLRAMLQTLLGERFQLTTHRETRQLSIYSLVTAKGGPKLAAAKDTGGRHGINFRNGGTILIGVNASMEEFAEALSFRVDRSVKDRTGLDGRYDFRMEFTPDETVWRFDEGQAPSAAADPDGGSLFTALQEQLGLKLESAKGPVTVLVVDQVERPSAN